MDHQWRLETSPAYVVQRHGRETDGQAVEAAAQARGPAATATELDALHEIARELDLVVVNNMAAVQEAFRRLRAYDGEDRAGRALFKLYGRPETTFHCLCGPSELLNDAKGRPLSCAPVFRNAVIDVVPRKSVKIYLFVRQYHTLIDLVTRIQACLHVGEKDQDVFFWPKDGKLELLFDYNNEEVARQCRNQQRNNAPHDDELTWHVARWFGLSPYHHTFSHGALQLSMQLDALQAHATHSRNISDEFLVRPLSTQRDASANHIDRRRYRDPASLRVAINNVNDVDEHNTAVWMVGEARSKVNPVMDLFMRATGAKTYRWHVPGLTCSELQGLGYWKVTPMGYDLDIADYSRPLWPAISKLSERLRQSFAPELPLYFTEEEKQNRITSAVLIDHRSAFNGVDYGYDSQQRARGINSLLRQVIRIGSQRELRLTTAPSAFSEHTPLIDQYRTLRRHRFFVVGEGAVLTLMVLSPPQTTWILVYNHSRPAGGFRHSNFHVGIARGLPHVRLIVYVIDSHRAVSFKRVLELMKAPFQPGVFHVGATAIGQPLPMNETIHERDLGADFGIAPVDNPWGETNDD